MSVLEFYLFLKAIFEIWDEAHCSIDILDRTDQWTFCAAEEKTTIKLPLGQSIWKHPLNIQECRFVTILLHFIVSYFSENQPVPGSDSHPLFKYTSTRSVFELFLPIHLKKYRVWIMQQSRTEKIKQQTPIPPKSRVKPRKSQNAPFHHLWFGRRWRV